MLKCFRTELMFISVLIEDEEDSNMTLKYLPVTETE